MGVKIIFLNGAVEEKLYVEKPLGLETHDKKTYVCRFKKALYGLKQSPRIWFNKTDSFLMSLGLSRVNHIPTFTIRLRTVNK